MQGRFLHGRQAVPYVEQQHQQRRLPVLSARDALPADTRDPSSRRKPNGRGTVRSVGKKYRWDITLGCRADGSRISRSGYEVTKVGAETAMSTTLTD
ncbi:hypothetical protein [Deinococcus yavapaiensis]|uniref:hypothetical protein n=1 Tax=Deinococcus yavapaiensis TaxID=309889 RepID=UPI000DA1B896|nr:hypothetical protein [Deinococcus yavapaiensis]